MPNDTNNCGKLFAILFYSASAAQRDSSKATKYFVSTLTITTVCFIHCAKYLSVLNI